AGGRRGERGAPGHHGQRQRHVLDGGGDRSGFGHAAPVVTREGRGHHPRAGLDGHQTAGGGGDAQRAHPVVAHRQRDHPGGDGGGRPAGRAARGAGQVPRVAGDPVL